MPNPVSMSCMESLELNPTTNFISIRRVEASHFIVAGPAAPLRRDAKSCQHVLHGKLGTESNHQFHIHPKG